MNDGAAAALLMTEAEASRRGIALLARICSWGDRRGRSKDQGHRADPCLPQSAGKSRLDDWRPPRIAPDRLSSGSLLGQIFVAHIGSLATEGAVAIRPKSLIIERMNWASTTNRANLLEIERNIFHV